MQPCRMQVVAVTIVLSLAAFCHADPPSVPSEPRSSSSDGESQAHRRAVWEQFLDLGPNERTQLHVMPYLTELEKAYDLNATQSGTVRAKLEAIADQRRTSMGSLVDEYDALANQAANVWWDHREAIKAADDGPRPPSFRENPAYQAATMRMLEIERQFPIEWDNVLEQVESLLPPDQASRGRINMYKNRIRRAARIAANQEIRAKKAASSHDGTAGPTGNARPHRATVKEVLSQAEKHIESEKMPPRVKARIRRTIRKTRENLEKPSASPAADKAFPADVARDLDRWEQFTRDFIKQHDLSETQQAASLSIMTDLRNRARALHDAHEERARNARPADREHIESERVKIEKRTEELFSQMLRRMESLLTVEQRRSARPSSTTRSTPPKDR